MKRQFVVNAEGFETRIALVEDDVLSELFVERARDRGFTGNIYKGKVDRILPGMQAAFVELGPGLERKAYLHVDDIVGGDDSRLFEGYDGGGEGDARPIAKKPAKSRKVEELVRQGQEILVQIVKEPVAAKGARVSGYLSIAGRHCVLMPGVDKVGVSRRISSDTERRRLRNIVNGARDAGIGFIVRTAAENAKEEEVVDDVRYLTDLWRRIGEKAASSKPATLIYNDLDLVLRIVRDWLRGDGVEMLIDNEELCVRAKKFAQVFMPEYVDRIRHYSDKQPIFDALGIEQELRTAMSRRVPLKSGGSIVFDHGEALTAIDVNTGSFVGKESLESTITKNNLEACHEIARQLRLRNVGGIIVVDFIDMESGNNRRNVWDEFEKAVAKDSSRSNITRMSELGLVEMTRKRSRESLYQLFTEPCPTCEGRGVVKSNSALACEILREVSHVGDTSSSERIAVQCPPAVHEILSKHERVALDAMEKRFQKKIDLTPNASLAPHRFIIEGRTLGVMSETKNQPRPKKHRRPKSKAGKPAAGNA